MKLFYSNSNEIYFSTFRFRRIKWEGCKRTKALLCIVNQNTNERITLKTAWKYLSKLEILSL